MLKSIEHVGLVASSLDRSVKFYAEILGFEVVNLVENRELGLNYARLALDKQVIEIMEYVDSRSGKHREWGQVDHICFCVEDINEATNHLKKLGVVFHADKPRKKSDGFFIFFEGPDGERLELVQKSIPDEQVR